MNTLNLKLPSNNIVKSILEILNPYLGYLTTQEILLLEIMISNKWTSITSDNRVAIRIKSNLEKYTFNNYIKKLKDKKVLLTKDNLLIVNPKIVRMTQSPSINIEFNEQ